MVARMKHVFVITLASCCCFALFACDSKAPATAATQQSKAPPAPATIVREDSNGKLQMTVPAAWHAVDQKPGLGLVLMLMPELRRDRTRFMGFVSIYLEKSPHDVSQL